MKNGLPTSEAEARVWLQHTTSDLAKSLRSRGDAVRWWDPPQDRCGALNEFRAYRRPIGQCGTAAMELHRAAGLPVVAGYVFMRQHGARAHAWCLAGDGPVDVTVPDELKVLGYLGFTVGPAERAFMQFTNDVTALTATVANLLTPKGTAA